MIILLIAFMYLTQCSGSCSPLAAARPAGGIEEKGAGVGAGQGPADEAGGGTKCPEGDGKRAAYKGPVCQSKTARL